MFDKPKRKNSEIVLTYYDRNWLFAFYRWARVSKSRDIHVPLSPEICIARLTPTEETRNLPSDRIYIRKREVVPLENGSGYEFQAQIRMGWRGYDQPDVNGLIVDDGYGQSLVTLRTYPGNLYTMSIVFLVLCCYGSWNSPERIAVCGFVFMLAFCCFGAIMDQHNSLDHIVDTLTKAQQAPSDPTLPPPVKIRHHKNMQRKF